MSGHMNMGGPTTGVVTVEATTAAVMNALPGINGLISGVNVTQLRNDYDTMAINVDQFFLLLMGSIIFFMQCGFAFLECGSVRMGNATNILFKNVMDSVVGAICYWMVGYAFAYGVPGNEFVGHNYFFLHNLDKSGYAMWFFQFSFAATASTILSGAVAERMEMGAYLVTSVIITAWIYPVVTHWTWGGGWLAERGFQDFAGSCVVHMCGGACALVGAAMLGPRTGRFDSKVKFGRGHSIPYVALGAFILFFGFLAFNGGSVGAITGGDSGEVMARAMVVTILAGSVSGLVCVVLHRKYSLTLAVNGALTGMVAACGGCNVYSLWAACPLGAFAALSYSLISGMLQCLRIDDPLDAVAVHFGGGLIGILYVPFFDINYGVIYEGSSKGAFEVLKWNAAGAAAVFGWSAGISFVLFSVMACLGLLRVKKDVEEKGMDVTKHNEPAYPDMVFVMHANGEMALMDEKKAAVAAATTGAAVIRPRTVGPGGIQQARSLSPRLQQANSPRAFAHNTSPNMNRISPRNPGAPMMDQTIIPQPAAARPPPANVVYDYSNPGSATNRQFNPRMNQYF